MSLAKQLQVKPSSGASYPIFIGTDILKNFSKLFYKYNSKSKKILFVSNSVISAKYLKSITSSFKKKIPYYFVSIPAGEKNKNLYQVNKILDLLTKENFNRQDTVVALGGGVIGDISGFAASIFKRGISFVQIPTTLLSQVDSSVGGKTGVNNKYGKNLIGTFYQPKFVLIDTLTLKSLPKREMVSGFAEILKYSLIMNKPFFAWLNSHGKNIINRSSSKDIINAIFISCKSKAIIVAKDEKEQGIRAILNFGHTLGHALESHLKYSKKLNHGEAIIIGMRIASKISHQLGFLTSKELEMIKNIYEKLNLTASIKPYVKSNQISQFIEIMKKDKKNNNNYINLILLKQIGKAFIYKTQVEKTYLPILKEEIRNG